MRQTTSKENAYRQEQHQKDRMVKDEFIFVIAKVLVRTVPQIWCSKKAYIKAGNADFHEIQPGATRDPVCKKLAIKWNEHFIAFLPRLFEYPDPSKQNQHNQAEYKEIVTCPQRQNNDLYKLRHFFPSLLPLRYHVS